MKPIVIFITLISFLGAGYGMAQDCGKCPAKSKCDVTEKTEKKAEKVYISTPKCKDADRKHYHQKDQCDLQEPVAVDLKEAVKEGYKPCPKCFPPKDAEDPEENDGKKS